MVKCMFFCYNGAAQPQLGRKEADMHKSCNEWHGIQLNFNFNLNICIGKVAETIAEIISRLSKR